jgi:branched-subunit amino acid ABC-type transport system permease component
VIRVLVVTLSTGAVYALVAVALNVVYRASGVLNFGGGFVAVFVGLFYANFALAGTVPGIVVAVLVGAGLGLMTYLAAVRFGERFGADPPALSLATLGFGILSAYFAGELWEQRPFSADALVGGGFELGGVAVSHQRVVAVVLVAAFVLALIAFVDRTVVGRAMEAAAHRRDLAELYGVNPVLVNGVAWLIGGAALALAGVLQGSIATVSEGLSLPLVVFGLAAAVAGGLGSIRGAVLGALLVALAQTAFTQYVSTRYSVTLVFALLFAVLAARPQGLLALARVERV